MAGNVNKDEKRCDEVAPAKHAFSVINAMQTIRQSPPTKNAEQNPNNYMSKYQLAAPKYTLNRYVITKYVLAEILALKLTESCRCFESVMVIYRISCGERL